MRVVTVFLDPETADGIAKALDRLIRPVFQQHLIATIAVQHLDFRLTPDIVAPAIFGHAPSGDDGGHSGRVELVAKRGI